jgi:hypothetical protein
MSKKSRGKIGLCPKCLEIKNLTKHHIFPKRFFGENDNVLYICRECHNNIESIIPEYYQLAKEVYLNLTKQFLTGALGV